MKKRVSIILIMVFTFLFLSSCAVGEKESTSNGNTMLNELITKNSIKDQEVTINKANIITESDDHKETEANEENTVYSSPEYLEYSGGELPDDIVQEIQYNVECKVVPNASAFIITLHGNNVRSYGLTSDKKSYYIEKDMNHITKMLVENKEREIHQEFTFQETFTPNITSFPYGLEFADWNFDGYMDISLWAAEGGTMLNVPTYFWLWNNEEMQFIRNVELEDISFETYMVIDVEKQQIEASYRHSDGYHYGVYKWQGGKLVLIRTEDIYWEDFIDDEPADSSEELVSGEFAIADNEMEIEDQSQIDVSDEYEINKNIADKITSFIPDGWAIVEAYGGEVVEGDLNNDNLSDIACVIENIEIQETAGQRALMIFTGNDDGTYELKLEAEHAIRRSDQGGIMGEPFMGLGINRGSLLIHHYGGSAWRWSTSYRFRFQDDGWYMIGATEDWFHATSNIGRLYEDINLLTGDFILIESDDDGVEKQSKGNRGKKSLVNLLDFDIIGERQF